MLMPKSEEPIVIMKLANRRLINTDTVTYVSPENLAGMVKQDEDFVICGGQSSRRSLPP